MNYEMLTLTAKRKRLVKRLEQIEREQRYGIWREGPKEPTRLKRAIAKIDRKMKGGKQC